MVATGLLTEAQVAQYRDGGWIAPIDVMSQGDAAAPLVELERCEQQYPTHLHAENRNNAHLAFPFLAQLATHPIIVGSAESLVGFDMALSSTVIFAKEPSSSAFVSWHQDAFYMGLATSDFVTAWVALSPSSLDSGCVSVIPGTHNSRADHSDTFAADNILTRGQQVTKVDVASAVHLELQPGQMSLHHPWLVHGSQPNTSGDRRVGIAMQSYLGSNVVPARGTHYLMHVQGAPIRAPFLTAQPPAGECTPDALQTRAAANDALAAVLYEGAQQVRSL